MSDDEAIDLVKSTFEKIKSAATNDELEKIPKDLSFEFEYDGKKYPPLKFIFSKEDVEFINQTFLKPESSILDIQPLLKDPIAKLLYSLAWKQGDLAKLKSIVEGMTEENDLQRKQSAIFRQFGRHLVNRDEPIIDQHVLRAYAVSKFLGDLSKVGSFRQQKQFDHNIINCYKSWFQKTKLSEEGGGKILDHILFGLGKTIKTSLVGAHRNQNPGI